MNKKFFFDVETTGLDPKQNAIHQLAVILEIDGEVKEKIDWKIRPFRGAKIDEKALKVSGVDKEALSIYPSQKDVFAELLVLLASYVDPYDPKDKFHLVGYNNRYFDDRFLRAWFELNRNTYFGSWFWADSLDVMVLASQYLYWERSKMPNFKLGTVAQFLGIKVLESNLHDGLYDVEITREIYNKITGADLF
jgi:DNA polymerase-3 subunit epsilon